MSYYWFNRQESLEKAKDRYHNGGGKQEADEYYLKNRENLNENANNKYKNLSEEEKEAKKISSKQIQKHEKSKSNEYQVVKY